jgi:hypothetical protein
MRKDTCPKQSNLVQILSLFSRLTSWGQSTTESRHKDTVQDLIEELAHIRTEASRECQYMQKIDDTSAADDQEIILLTKRKRLLYLFMKDLAVGVSESILSNQAQRASSPISLLVLNGVPFWQKQLSWIFILFMNFGLLFYVYLFAMNQTHSRQSAWFHSFQIWLIFEIFISATSIVIFNQLLIPLMVLVNVTKIKEKVLADLMAFRESYLNHSPLDEEIGNQQIPHHTSRTTHNTSQQQTTQQRFIFNSAEYLFISWRVAKDCPEISESRLIHQFTTPWPKKKYGEKQLGIASGYDQDVVASGVSQVSFYFIDCLLHCHLLIQDILIQTLCNTGFGLLGLCLIRLFSIHPMLPIAVVGTLFLIICYLLMIFSKRNSELRERLVATKASQSILLSQQTQRSPVVQTQLTDDRHRERRDSRPVCGEEEGCADESSSNLIQHKSMNESSPSEESSSSESKSSDSDSDESKSSDSDSDESKSSCQQSVSEV